MARWRLRNAHYLNVPGTEYEYTETSRESGRQFKKRFPVPRLLDPRDSSDHNYPGEIIVCRGEPKSVNNRDLQFLGDPTPDMEPLDAEAEKISDSFKEKWVHPIESLPSFGDYSASLIQSFERQMKAISDQAPKNVSVNVSQSEFDSLKDQVAKLVQQNTALIEELKEKPRNVRRAT